MTVLQVCAYAAPSPGNFISSLLELEKQIKELGGTTIYAFTERAKNLPWCKKLQEYTKVYFLPEAKARILPKTYQVFRKIYRENNVDIIHSHFELYDIPATVTAPKNARIFWHLHDPITPELNLRGLLWRFQYGVVGRKAKLMAVSDYYRQIVVNMGFPSKNTINILNGIDLTRIRDCREKPSCSYDFVTFGWDFYRKGDDLILDACKKLQSDGYKFKFLLNGNDQTWCELDKHLNGEMPDFLVLGESVSDINQIFDDCEVFVQASRKETFSYAVCESAYAGLPVICSDIPGLEWAHFVPSVSFFQNNDVDGLYQLMKNFLDGKNIPDALIDESRQYIKEFLSLEVWAKNIINQYFS